MSNNTKSTIVLTEQGLSAIAVQPWPMIAIKYFLPMYDESIDSLIHTEGGLTSAVPLSAAITSADTQVSLIGERIYNIPQTSGVYELSDGNFATLGVGATFNGNETISNSTVNRTHSRTLINGKTLSPIVSGTVQPIYDIASMSLQYVGGEAALTNVNTWAVNGANIPRENLFNGVSFSPSQDTSGSYNYVNGQFKFTLSNKVGAYRFNKIAFFIQKMNENGTVDTDFDPVLFGQAAVDVSQTVGVNGIGSQDFEVTIQLAFTTRDGTVLLTNNDYWTMIPTSGSNRQQNGLFFAGDVALGTSSIPSSWKPNAKLQITDNTEWAQIRLSHTTALSGLDIKVTDTGTSGMVNFIPTSAYANGFGFSFGKNNTATSDNNESIAIAAGLNNAIVGRSSFAFGENNNIVGKFSNAIGLFNLINSSTSGSCFAIGSYNHVNDSTSLNLGAFAFGLNSSAANGAFAIGDSNEADGYCSIAIGSNSKASRDGTQQSMSIAIGNGAYAVKDFTVSIGQENYVNSPYSFSFGANNTIQGGGLYNGIIGTSNIVENNGNNTNWVFGSGNYLSHTKNTVVVGIGNNATSLYQINPLIFGHNNNGNESGILIGNNNSGSGYAFGKYSYAYYDSVAIGTSADAHNDSSISIGVNSRTGNTGICLNPEFYIMQESKSNIAIGCNSLIYGEAALSIVIGRDSYVNATSGHAMSMGYISRSDSMSIAFGSYSQAYGTESIAIGYKAKTFGEYESHGSNDFAYRGQIAIGAYANVWDGGYGIAIGWGAKAHSNVNGLQAVAIGYATEAEAANSMTTDLNYYSTAVIGDRLENKYASFMAGRGTLTLAEMEAKHGTRNTWNFAPSIVFGTDSPSGGSNAFSISTIRLVDAAIYKTGIILDTKNLITLNTENKGAITSYLRDNNAPEGTIFKSTPNAYGFSTLHIWADDEDTYNYPDVNDEVAKLTGPISSSELGLTAQSTDLDPSYVVDGQCLTVDANWESFGLHLPPPPTGVQIFYLRLKLPQSADDYNREMRVSYPSALDGNATIMTSFPHVGQGGSGLLASRVFTFVASGPAWIVM